MVSDEALMQRAARDDLEASGELFDRHHPGMCAFASRFLGDAATAEDVVQEAFWKVWQGRSTYDGRQPFRPWLYAIVRNTALNELKKPHRRARPLSAVPQGEQDRSRPVAGGNGHGSLPHERVLTALSVGEQVRAALLALPEDQRLCLILKEYEGCTHAEIGAIAGVSEGNARVLTHRARRALRESLRPLLEAEEAHV